MAETSSPGVLIYNGKPYAVGLLWFTVQEDQGKILLQKRLQKTHADFYCLRQHISQQQGFGWLAKGHRRGMPVAAAMIADQLVGEWHGVFEAENGWWYVQVRSDTITPQGDQFFTSEEEAYNLFQSEMQKHTWPHAYAPEKWRITDANTRELSLKNLLDDFVTTKLVGANITAVFGSKAARNLAFGVLGAVVLVMMGLIAWTFLKPEPVIPPSKTNFVPRTTTKPVIVVPSANNQFVSPQQMLNQCGDAASKLIIALPGWTTQTFNCGGGKASVSWKQVTGTLGDAKEQGAKTWPDMVAVNYTNHVMTVTLALPKLPTLSPTTLATQEQALLDLEQNLQPLGALQVKPVAPAPPPPVKPGSPPPKPATPAAPVANPYLDIQFLSGFSPETIGPLLDAPGIEVNAVEWSIPRGIWQYKVKWTHDKVKPAPAPNATQKGNAGAAPVAAAPAGGEQK